MSDLEGKIRRQRRLGAKRKYNKIRGRERRALQERPCIAVLRLSLSNRAEGDLE